MSFFDQVAQHPPDPIFGLQAAFRLDKRPTKVDLSVGVYKTEEGNTPIMGAVKKAEKAIFESEKSKEYLPPDGDKKFLEQVGVLTFGAEWWKKSSSRVHAAQTIGGTGGLRLGGDFLKQEIGDTIYISDPTWPNHRGVFTRCGLKVIEYPYYDPVKRELDFAQFYNFLSKLPEKSIILLQTCCHNPTGADLNFEQWKKLSHLFFERNFFPFFDCAYQGFDRSMEEDVQPIRLFAESGHALFAALSYSKNFSLYGERVGALFSVASSEKIAENVASKIKNIIRQNYSNPPRHGAAIVSTILQTPDLRREWEKELGEMRTRINQMRKQFADALVSQATKNDFSFLEDCIGLFSFCGLHKEQVARLIEEFGIYMTGDGRVNIAGLNQRNLDYVVQAIIKVSEE